MKSFTKKTLSVVFAMLMALTSLTVGAFSASAAEIKNYTAVLSEGSNTLKHETAKDADGDSYTTNNYAKFTAQTTAYYNITVSAVTNNEDNTTTSTGASVDWGTASSDTATYVSCYNDISTESHTVKYVDSDKALAEKSVYVPGVATVKFEAGKTYYFDINGSTGTTTTLNIEKAEYAYYLSAKAQTSSLTYVEDEETYTTEATTGYDITANITNYYGTSTTITVPGQLGGYAVKSVSLYNMDAALKKRVTSVTLPEGVTSIYYMNNMYALTSVNFPTTLETIGDYCFAHDHSLTGRIVIPATVKSVGSYAFYDTGIDSAQVLGATTKIGAYAFGYKEVADDASVDPTDTVASAVDGFFIVAPLNSRATTYANQNGFAAYDPANCTVGNHPYAVTTVPATIFAKGSTTSVCPVCGNTVKATIKKKKFKIKSLKSTKKNTIVVKAKKQSDIKGYQIQYSTTKKFKKKKTTSVKVKTTKKLSKTIKGLKSGKKYYVRVRAYKTSGKKTVYSTWTKTKSVKVK